MLYENPGRRYEVTVLRDKRWLIDCLARSEPEARARAEELYAGETVDAVRVVRARFGGDGTSYETLILERVRGARRGEAPVRLAAAPSEDAWCETQDDLYGPASRRAIARLLRNFLDRYAITPTELLHHHRYMRLLERQDTLLPQVVQRMAALQARARGVDGRERLDTLDRFVEGAANRARDALASRAAPRLTEGALATLAAAVAERAHAPADQAFYTRFAVSRALEDVNSTAGKLEMAMGWVAATPPPLMPLIDELAAGLLGAASLIRDVLGPQAHLGGALAMLADLAAGRAIETKGLPPAIVTLATLLGSAGMPESRRVLVDRIQRELASDKPLSRDDRAGQRRLFETLLDKLLDEHGLFVGGQAMVEAIARRSRGFELVGGIEVVRFETEDPAGRIERLLGAAQAILSERQQRAIATCIAEMIDRFDGDPAVLAALAPRIAATRLPEGVTATLLGRMPRPVAGRPAVSQGDVA